MWQLPMKFHGRWRLIQNQEKTQNSSNLYFLIFTWCFVSSLSIKLYIVIFFFIIFVKTLFSFSFINKRTKWDYALAIHSLYSTNLVWLWTSLVNKSKFWLWSFIKGEVWKKKTRKNIQFSISFGLSCLSSQDFFQI